ncbi:DUF2750 domain-containing protein [Hymenobacter bucti]|uniref:DUF2750 domain-containing protein n=1 Tax=Hymenobacter bucti TaxID=1844114 RepID=A0ABW4QY42_9BACT
MEYNPNPIEVDKVSALKPFDRYKYTAKKVADFKLVYTLVHEDGTWALAKVERKTIVALWPAAVYAQANATGVWANYQTLVISLNELLSTRLESFEKNGFLINVFSKPSKTGFVVSSDKFRADLEEELENC